MAVFRFVVVTTIVLTMTLTSTEAQQVYTDRLCLPTGEWIPKSKVCDKYQDCSDDSDEINCVCDTSYQYACTNGRCIYKTWLCDGVKDCPLGEDESLLKCPGCQLNQFQCKKSRACISSALKCDGKSDCDDSSDETQCVSLTGLLGNQQLTVTYKGTAGNTVCSDNWNDTWSNRVCNLMGFGTASSTNYVLTILGPFVSLNTSKPYSNFISSLKTGNCPSQRTVSVSCRPAECGIRTVSGNVGQYIINGQRAQRGAWPWQVIVYVGYQLYGKFNALILCGGMLISNRWLLTASHCLRMEEYDSRIGYTGTLKPANLQILLGTISRSSNNDMIVASADRVYVHPDFVKTSPDNDVGLIRLSQTVSFSDTVRPICLPGKNPDLKRFKVCADTGFGTTSRNDNSDYLLQARMNVLSDSECSKASSYYKAAYQLCVGTVPTAGDSNTCFGDSGGPFACQDPNGVWMAIGVNSYAEGSRDPNQPAIKRCQRSFVTRVSAYVDWINSTMAENST